MLPLDMACIPYITISMVVFVISCAYFPPVHDLTDLEKTSVIPNPGISRFDAWDNYDVEVTVFQLTALL